MWLKKVVELPFLLYNKGSGRIWTKCSNYSNQWAQVQAVRTPLSSWTSSWTLWLKWAVFRYPGPELAPSQRWLWPSDFSAFTCWGIASRYSGHQLSGDTNLQEGTLTQEWPSSDWPEVMCEGFSFLFSSILFCLWFFFPRQYFFV